MNNKWFWICCFLFIPALVFSQYRTQSGFYIIETGEGGYSIVPSLVEEVVSDTGAAFIVGSLQDIEAGTNNRWVKINADSTILIDSSTSDVLAQSISIDDFNQEIYIISTGPPGSGRELTVTDYNLNVLRKIDSSDSVGSELRNINEFIYMNEGLSSGKIRKLTRFDTVIWETEDNFVHLGVDIFSNIYVGNVSAENIVKLSSDSEQLISFGTNLDLNSTIEGKLIVLDEKGFVYLSAGDTINKFTPTGDTVWTITNFTDGSVIRASALSKNHLIVGTDTGIFSFLKNTGSQDWVFNTIFSTSTRPNRVSADTAGNVYVAYGNTSGEDSGILKLSSTGNLIWNKDLNAVGKDIIAHPGQLGTQSWFWGFKPEVTDTGTPQTTLSFVGPKDITSSRQFNWLVDAGIDRIVKFDTDGTITDSFPRLSLSENSIAYDGHFLWTLNTGDTLVKRDVGGTVINQIKTSETANAFGLTWNGHFFVYGDGVTDEFKFLNRDGNVDLSLSQPFPATIDTVSGLEWDGNRYWMLARIGTDPPILMELDRNFNVIKDYGELTFIADNEPRIMFNGQSLWITDAINDEVYEVK